jgi:hypothetical protein
MIKLRNLKDNDMTNKNYPWVKKVLAGSLLIFCQIGWAQTPPPSVSIAVSQSNVSGGVRYSYQVSNHSSSPITSIVIGLNYFDGKPELSAPPSGWTLSGGIPSTSVSSPSGWSAKITPTEDTDLLLLTWSAASSGALAPGQTLQGFSVLVPSANSTYSGSHWTVYVNNAGTNYFTGLLTTQVIACDQPRLSFSLSPSVVWPPNHKLVAITANISAQDDAFPNPVIKLESIKANETLNPGDVVASIGTSTRSFRVKSKRTGTNKAGRIYTITYSATNSCGNSVSASQTVTVPHDKSR